MRFVALANMDNVNYWVCAIGLWVRLSLLGDSCLVSLDKFVALYWSTEYKAKVTNSKVTLACTTSKIVALIWIISSLGSNRQVTK